MVTWLMIAAGDNREHRGNDGYDDEPSAYYSWDSTVAHSRAVAPRDRIVLWDKKTLLGASIIEAIDEGERLKVFYRCPACGKAGFKARLHVRPVNRCSSCRGEFDEPAVHWGMVTTFRSTHDAA